MLAPLAWGKQPRTTIVILREAFPRFGAFPLFKLTLTASVFKLRLDFRSD